MKKMIIVAMCLLPFTLSAGAEPRHKKRKPPREAVDACKDKSSGDSCSFTSPRHGELKGTCWAPDADKPLACKPKNPPRRRGGGEEPE